MSTVESSTAAGAVGALMITLALAALHLAAQRIRSLPDAPVTRSVRFVRREVGHPAGAAETRAGTGHYAKDHECVALVGFVIATCLAPGHLRTALSRESVGGFGVGSRVRRGQPRARRA